ncbi:hypothetical protein V6N11_064089 [Hibiscus sabdariffa]|uniref:PHD finger protein ALFIN-LIKE n=1 Tax=Hibiscus sabdariffa TaxID=183260 RepID=A0ABR2PN28_9ROSI
MEGGGGAQYNPRTVEEMLKNSINSVIQGATALLAPLRSIPAWCAKCAEMLKVVMLDRVVDRSVYHTERGSDAWLLSVAFYFGARFGFDKADRKRLFNMINDLPTIFEVVTGAANKQTKEKSSVSNHSSNKSKSNSKTRESQAKHSKASQPKDEEGGLEDEDEDEHGETLCGACGENYASDEFWICCDVCEKWFHGKCVKITPARAEHIKQYKCPTCSNKRTRP